MTLNIQKQNTPLTTPPSITQLILDRIEAEAITPTPKINFMLSEFGIWLLWCVTVVFGAVALAISVYVTMSAQYALYEATHENFVTFFVSVMPIVWILLFAGMTYLSVYEIKKTKRGYRYSTFLVLGSNIVSTLLGAMILHNFGLGYALDSKLGQEFDMYQSMDKMEQQMWQMPKEGRLVGELTLTAVFDGETIPPVLNFKDSSGVTWRFSVDELSERELTLLAPSIPVRVIGTTTSEFTFHACGVFPWEQGRALPWQEMHDSRRQFDAVMHAKMEKIEEWADRIEGEKSEKPPSDSLCAHLPIMKRMR